MSDRCMVSWWRWLLCLAIAYTTFEAWAQYRFARENPLTPFGMRANMGVDFYDAFKPIANFRGRSVQGELFITDKNGFRLPEHRATASNSTTFLIGGDSRIYGYSLPWKENFSAALQRLHGGHVHLQAFPGGSPALFNHEMWKLGVFDSIEPKPNVVIYDYDSHDGYGDRDFKIQQTRSAYKNTLTRLKLSIGGYGIQRLLTVARGFLQQWGEDWPQGWSLSLSSPSTPSQSEVSKTLAQVPAPIQQKTSPASRPEWRHRSSVTIDHEELRIMSKECKQRGVRLILLYQPRLLEISGRDSKMLDELAALCRKLDIELIETFSDVDASIFKDDGDFPDWFADPQEGIHLTSEALEHTAKKVIKYLSEVQP